jgi:hypothetical protein
VAQDFVGGLGQSLGLLATWRAVTANGRRQLLVRNTPKLQTPAPDIQMRHPMTRVGRTDLAGCEI